MGNNLREVIVINSYSRERTVLGTDSVFDLKNEVNRVDLYHFDPNP